MAYFTSGILQGYASNARSYKSVTRNLRKAVTDSAQVRVFLSHSHADIAGLSHEDVEAVRILLAGHGADVYIDSEDAAMPSVTSSETATILKKRIRSCDKFILLATVNARKSKWVPWELGFADEAKGMHNVAILPLADSSGNWEGNEYMGLYQTIEIADDDYAAIFPAYSNTGRRLGSFLQ